MFAGDYTGIDFEQYEGGSTGNIVQNNTISGSIPNLGTPSPNPSGDRTDLIKLAESYFNTISHNIIYIPGYISSTPEIPSYNLIVVLGAMGLVSGLLVAATIKRKSKKI